jgi:hypothetical protein
MKRHHSGEVAATRDRLPLILITHIVFLRNRRVMIFANPDLADVKKKIKKIRFLLLVI